MFSQLYKKYKKTKRPTDFEKYKLTPNITTAEIRNAQVTHSRTGRRISHGYNTASFVAIRIGP